MEETFRKLLERPADSHKYDYGHVLVIGGSPGMVGAPFLAAKAAMRTGAGLVTIASEAAVIDKLERRVEEIMTLRFKTVDDVITFVNQRKVSVAVIGPGLSAAAQQLARQLIGAMPVPLIIDGGALGALQNHLEVLRQSQSEQLILTPHTGEFQRLIEKPLPKNRAQLKPIAEQFTVSHPVILVLKGQLTLVGQSGRQFYENHTGNPGLATAGSGDVLSGMIAGLIAQRLEPFTAATAAVYLHGLAGDKAAGQKTEPGMIASDIIEAIPAALQDAAK